MISYTEATTRISRAAWLLPPERLPIPGLLGRVLAEDVFADSDQPPFNKSSMDGYACRAADAHAPLRVLEHIPAGKVPRHVIEPGTCSKIMTGAPVPQGADCVLIVEEVEELDSGFVRFTGVKINSNIVPQGEDVRRGDRLLEAGTLLRAQHLPVLASSGEYSVPVRRQPRVAIIATGDELVSPDTIPGPGQIRNSNSIQLTALAREAGANAVDLGIARDEQKTLQDIWARALAEHDVVFSTGGVSMGDYDLVPDILRHHGFEIHFDRVAIQPGKPVLFGTRGEQACFGLSGNPVSSFLQFMLFARPFLHALQGNRSPLRTLPMILGEQLVRRNPGRLGWIPVRFDKEGRVHAVPFHGSAHIHAFTQADGLIAYPPGVTTLDAGSTIPVFIL